MSLRDLVRTKDVDTVIHQNDDPAGSGEGPGLKRGLRLPDLVGFGVGIVIGTGIFTLTGTAAKDHAGPAVSLSFAIAGVVALMAALCYAELAAAVPTAGSSYTYAYATIGEIFAWIIAWDLILEFMLGAAVVARGWSGYLQGVFDLPKAIFGETDSVVNLGAVFIVLVLGVVAAIGIRESKLVTNALVVIKVSVCLFIIAVGLFVIDLSNQKPYIPPTRPAEDASALKQPLWQFVSGIDATSYGFTGVLVAAAIVFFAYSGFEAVANLGEESKNPQKDMPRGLIGTLILCGLLYVAVTFVLTSMVKYSRLDSSDPLADAFDQRGLAWAGVLIGVAAVAGLTSVILVEIVTLGRIGFALCRDGLLPPGLGKIHPKYQTPTRMTALVVVGIAILGAFVPLTALAEMVSIGTLFAFLVVSIAVIVLRRTKPKMKRPFRTPSVPFLPIATAVLCVALMTNLAVETWLRFIVWFALGLAIYFGYGRRHSKLRAGAQGQGTPAS